MCFPLIWGALTILIKRALRAALFAVAGAIASIAPASAAGSKAGQQQLSELALSTIAIEVSDSDSNFTVIDSRFDETATAAVLFGVVGAAANSAANAAEDDKKADALRGDAEKAAIRDILADSLVRSLSKPNGLAVETDSASAAHRLRVEIHNWGLIRVSREDQRMRTFLNLSVQILDPKGGVVWEKKRENSVGQTMAAFEEWSGERLVGEMESLARKAGEYVGNQIVYR